MKYIINNIINHSRVAVLMCLMALSTVAMAQISSVHGTISDDFGPLMGATVCEIDGNNRIVESTVTDMNGNFVMKVKNEKNRIRFSYVGLKTKTMKIDRSSYDIMMESATTLQEVTVNSKRRLNGNSLPIPEREVSFARQGISTKDFEGLGINTIDEALQGRIAGLDIVGASGNAGAGSVIRLRGATSLSSNVNSNPLVVVDGNVRDVDMELFDANASDMNEQMAQLLNINTEDIASLEVLLDGAGAAIYGSQGSNGVIEITTKRGVRGKPQLTYSLKLTGTYQGKGYNLLSGDDYTMMLKEAYFNPEQREINVPEINYDPTFSEYQQYNNNTDWYKAVTRVGLRQNHHLTISGGGERAQFRISAGYDNESVSVLAEGMERLSTRVNLDYTVSQRIRVQTNFSMMYTKYNHQSNNLINIALKKMPNMGIYEQDPTTGADTDVYYDMLQSGRYIGSEIFKDDQRTNGYVNPVASGNLAKNVNTQYDLTPELVLTYDLLGLDEDHHRLKYRGSVLMNIFNNYTDSFYPSALVSTTWGSGHNNATMYSGKSIRLTTKHELTYIPAFKNKDHSLMAMLRMELKTNSNSSQSTNATGLPSGGIESPNAGGLITSLGSSYNNGRELYFTFTSHYGYKGGRYSADFTLRADGTTRLGPDQRWVYIPAASARWNIIDEPFMAKVREGGVLTMLSVRPSWSYGAQQPGGYFLYTSKYYTGTGYLNMASMYPGNLRLSNLQCERTNNLNLGFDLGFWGERLTMAFEIFNNTRSNMLMGNYRIPSNTGYPTIGSYNTGKMRNTGWSLRLNSNNLVKKGKFSMDVYVNFSNERSRLLELDETVLNNLNSTFTNGNAQVLNRVQVDNPLNSIYGFRSKGVYEYQYETIKDMTVPEDKARREFPEWDSWTIEQKQQAWVDKHSAPVAKNADGQIIRDDEGDPIRMKFNYAIDNTGKNYDFKGGDAIYEDVNHDGQINALDIVYLGSSLPKVYGGFGFTFKYGAWRLSANFSYRVGVDVFNRARLNSEAMISNDNQSQAVNYRWRKEGDGGNGEPVIPRAMYGGNTNYNTLLSDRFIEDGSFVRLGFLQLNYTLNKKQLKWIGLNRINLYASANNLFVISKYSGVDPEISARGYGIAEDWGQTPKAKSFTFGMTVDF